jgi:hypothetical protein
VQGPILVEYEYAVSNQHDVKANFVHHTLQADDAPPQQPGMEQVLSMLVNGGSLEPTAAEAPADGDAAQSADSVQEQRAQALDQLLASFRDAFGDNGGSYMFRCDCGLNAV